MVDRYYRKIEGVKNDIKNAMQISSILLKLKEYDDNLGKIDTNENNISSNLTKVNDNENSISNTLEKIGNISEFILKSDKDFEKTYNIEPQIFKFNTNNYFFSILEKEINHEFKKNSLLLVKIIYFINMIIYLMIIIEHNTNIIFMMIRIIQFINIYLIKMYIMMKIQIRF